MKLFWALAVSAVAMGSANAADLAARPYTKAPPALVTPVYDWSGFYVGVHGGGAWMRGDSRDDPLPSVVDFNRAADSFRLDGSGGVAGVHGGYNWQFSRTWLLGVEGDWSWTDIKTSASAPIVNALGVPFGPPAFPGTHITMMNRDLDWLASARLRLGWTRNNLLLYVTGGAAWGDVGYFATTPSVPAGFVWATPNFRRTESGFVVGAGGEWGITRNVVLRAEYLFYRLAGTSSVVDGVPPIPPFQIRYSWNEFDTHVGRIGLSYKFGGPVVAKY